MTKQSESYQLVVENLPQLTEQERRSVFSVLTKLSPALKQAEAAQVRSAAYRWSALLYELSRDYVRNLPTELNFLPVATITQLGDVARQLDIELRTIADHEDITQLKQSHRVAWYRLYLALTKRYLARHEVPVTLKTLCQHADKFSSLVDASFPGYVSTRVFIRTVLR
jgi:hypothetical protein